MRREEPFASLVRLRIGACRSGVCCFRGPGAILPLSYDLALGWGSASAGGYYGACFRASGGGVLASFPAALDCRFW